MLTIETPENAKRTCFEVFTIDSEQVIDQMHFSSSLLQKSYSEKFHKTHKKTPTIKSFFK